MTVLSVSFSRPPPIPCCISQYSLLCPRHQILVFLFARVLLFPETGLRFPRYFASDFVLTETFQKPNSSSSDRADLLFLREMLLGNPLSFFYRKIFGLYISLFVFHLLSEWTVHDNCCLCHVTMLFVSLALQPLWLYFSQPRSGL